MAKKEKKQAKEIKIKGNTNKKTSLQFWFMGTIITTVVLSVSLCLIALVPKAKDIITNLTLSNMSSDIEAAKYKLESTGTSCEMNLYADIDELFGDLKVNGMPGSYSYIVNKEGKIVYHPIQDNIGKPNENEFINGIVAKIQEGEIPEDDTFTYVEQGTKKYAGYGITTRKDIVIVTADENEVYQDARNIVKRGILVGFGLLFIFVIYGYFISKIIAKPLVEIVGIINNISEGYINNDIKTTSSIKDTADLINASKKLQDNLQSIVSEIRNASNNLTESVSSTNSLCNTSADGANQITMAVDELSLAAQSMAESVQDLSGNMSDIGDNIEGITGAVEELTNSSANMNTISDQAAIDIQDVYESSLNSVEAVDAIADHMKELVSAIDEVSNATKLIGDISEQTNLLSLNASIEAARAGEAGRGFAVVAQEIGSLAAQSQDSVTQIDAIANNIIQLSKVSTSLTEKIKNIIAEEQNKVQKTKTSFTQLKEQIDNSVVQIQNISSQTENLEISKEKAISSVADLSAISEENAASNQEVTSSISNLSLNINDISSQSDDMSDMAVTLSESIKAFKE